MQRRFPLSFNHELVAHSHYCFGIRWERPLCDEVHLNLAYRWFCGSG